MRRPRVCPHCSRSDRLNRVRTRPEGVLWFCDACLLFTNVEKPVLCTDRVKLAARGLLAEIVPGRGPGRWYWKRRRMTR